MQRHTLTRTLCDSAHAFVRALCSPLQTPPRHRQPQPPAPNPQPQRQPPLAARPTHRRARAEGSVHHRCAMALAYSRTAVASCTPPAAAHHRGRTALTPRFASPFILISVCRAVAAGCVRSEHGGHAAADGAARRAVTVASRQPDVEQGAAGRGCTRDCPARTKSDRESVHDEEARGAGARYEQAPRQGQLCRAGRHQRAAEGSQGRGGPGAGGERGAQGAEPNPLPELRGY